LALVGGFNQVQHLCNGFLPQNDLKIPVTGIRSGGLSQEQFNKILDKLEKYYTPIVAAKGGNYHVNRLWEDETVNASADRQGKIWNLNMYGGLARYSSLGEDGYLLVGCHETGHHLGGAPKSSGWNSSSWASNEGEADYYSTLRCMRYILQNEDNVGYVNSHPVDLVLRQSCESAYADVNAQSICIRSGMAAMNVAMIFHDLKKDAELPNFNTPDPAQVTETDDSHPATQCRLDTYYQAAICVHEAKTELSDSDYHVGTCTDESLSGVRPRCWFLPNSSLQTLAPQASR
jgi:hypothetical protein